MTVQGKNGTSTKVPIVPMFLKLYCPLSEPLHPCVCVSERLVYFCTFL